MERYEVAAMSPLPSGEQVLRFDFAYDGGKPGAGGVGRISLGGAKLAEGRIARTHPFIFSGDEGADVGEDLATPVTEDYQVPAIFTGIIRKITIEVQPILAADRSAVDLTDIEGLKPTGRVRMTRSKAASVASSSQTPWGGATAPAKRSPDKVVVQFENLWRV